MELVLVRHGQPDWEPGGRAVDEPTLTANGHQQAQRVAELLARQHFDALLVSPLRRARDTALPIAKKLGLEAQVESWLREVGLPSMAGRTPEEVQHFFGSSRARQLDKQWDGMPGGESFRHFYERVSAGVEGLLLGDHRLQIHEDGVHRLWRLPQKSSQRLLIVAHEGTNSVIVSHLLGIEPVPWAWMRFSSDWAGVTRLQVRRVSTGVVWSLVAFNQIHHLAGLDREHKP